ncbi:MAG: hypothetical protein RJA76_1549 [Bacteroidota bacterium]|jgi:hypothetical protein
MRIFLFTFCLLHSLTSFSNPEDYETQQAHDFQYYIDCGIPEGSVRGGQFSTYDLDCWCERNKARDRNEALKYFGIGTIFIIILTVIVRRLKKDKTEINEFNKLIESINGILLTLIEIESTIHNSDVVEHQINFKEQLIKIQMLIETTVLNRVEKYKWDDLKPINISAISNNPTTLGIALNRISTKLSDLNKFVK